MTTELIRSAMMRTLKRLVVSTALVAMVFSTFGVNAAEYYESAGGCGYEECRRAPAMAPAIALGTIAIIAIIAIAVQNSSGKGGHGHCH